ncbi:spore germination protein [Brockia lithotrophica]|uniref:Spore germination protein n=1 Tax=Brockia lithotrophica TaxID=933949 RepID=A0A660L5I8_9BACL|nr:spore germination protein [Brockia lithotrophica]RKQ88474.1 spore germination protein [Brockia lithotrophica]
MKKKDRSGTQDKSASPLRPQDALRRTFEGLADFVSRTLEDGPKRATLLYVKTVADEDKIQRYLVRVFFETDASRFRDYLKSHPFGIPYADEGQAAKMLLNGAVFVEFEGEPYLLDLRLLQDTGVQRTEVEPVLQGPLNSLSETLLVNLNLLRFRYKQVNLAIELGEIGTRSQTNVALVYDRDLVKSHVLEALRKAIQTPDLPALFAAGQLERVFAGKFTLFPSYMVTDRPDRILQEITHGKVALLLDGSEFALIAPAYFFDFFASMDDVYHPGIARLFFLTMRFTAVLVTLLTPALYVALTVYNPGAIRLPLTLSVAGSRAAVPFSAFFEVLFMMLAVELLLEASMRLPKSISAAATTVGGIILGQATTTAGIVSDVMILVIAVVAISSFVVPVNPMLYAVRIARYPLIGLASLFGLAGILVGFAVYLFALAERESFGEPYFYLPFSAGTSGKGVGR